MYRQPTGLPIPKTGLPSKPVNTPAKETEEQAKKKRALAAIKKGRIAAKGLTCEGCGEHTAYLDLSHLASQKQYPELALNLENVRLHCRTCHDKWHGDIPGREHMIDYKPNLKILGRICPQALEKLTK